MFYITLLVCSYLFFSQQNVPTDIAHSDKYGHVAVFFTLSLLLYKGFSLTIPKQILIVFSYGIAVEIIQSFIPYRSGGIDDVVADLVGILLFYYGARFALLKISRAANND
jgi:VanZ family protein